MVKKINVIGLIVGILILALAIYAFQVDIEITQPDVSTRMEALELIEDYYSDVDYVDMEYYGGDAYTGIQQAAAQTANNVGSVFELLTYEALSLNSVNNNICTLNKNNAQIAEAEADNSALVVKAVQNGVFVILLALGLTLISKSITIEIPLGEKKKETEEIYM